MGYGLQRHEDIGLGEFALIELANLRFIAHRKVGGFDKRPGQVLIAILRVPLPLPLLIAQLPTAGASAAREGLPMSIFAGCHRDLLLGDRPRCLNPQNLLVKFFVSHAS